MVVLYLFLNIPRNIVAPPLHSRVYFYIPIYTPPSLLVAPHRGNLNPSLRGAPHRGNLPLITARPQHSPHIHGLQKCNPQYQVLSPHTHSKITIQMILKLGKVNFCDVPYRRSIGIFFYTLNIQQITNRH